MHDADRIKKRRHDLTIIQGETYKHTFHYRDFATNAPINLSGWTARMQVRPSVASSTILYEATTATGDLAVDAALGDVKLVVPESTTKNWTWKKGVYDSELTNGSEVEKFVYGTIRVKSEITR